MDVLSCCVGLGAGPTGNGVVGEGMCDLRYAYNMEVQ